MMEEVLELHYEERAYQYYNLHTVLDDKGLTYEEYKKMCIDKANENAKAMTIDIEEVKKENEDILKSFLETR